MAKNVISQPKQRRSIEKKQRIIEAGLRLFCQKGFYNTNTVEIAQSAGVSTGIVYRYFPDKKAIFLECLPSFFDSIYSGIYAEIQSLSPPFDFENTLSQIIDAVVAAHSYSKDAHEEMMAMSYSDPDVKRYFVKAYAAMNAQLSVVIEQIGLHTDSSYEKLHIIIDMIECYCHEVVFEKDDRLNYSLLKKILIKGIEDILR